MSSASMLASRYPSVVEATFDDVQQAKAALQALEEFDLGKLPSGFDRYTLIERQPAVLDARPQDVVERLLVLVRGRRAPTTPTRTVRPEVVLLVRGQADRLQVAASLLQEYGARHVHVRPHGT